MKKIKWSAMFGLCAVFLLAGSGDTDNKIEKGSNIRTGSPQAPDHPDSAMYALESIFDRLNTGVPGSKRTSGFVEPEVFREDQRVPPMIV